MDKWSDELRLGRQRVAYLRTPAFHAAPFAESAFEEMAMGKALSIAARLVSDRNRGRFV